MVSSNSAAVARVSDAFVPVAATYESPCRESCRCMLDGLALARRGWVTAANPPTKQAFTTNRARERAYRIRRSAMIEHGIFDRAGAGIVSGGLAQSP
jgi:hypothetical protein